MRILQVVPRWQIGGAEKMTLHLGAALRDLGHSVGFFAWSGGGDLVPAAKSLDAEANSRHICSRWSVPRWFDLVSTIRNGRYDIVHGHLFPISYWLAVSSGFHGAQSVFTEHSVANRRRQLFGASVLEKKVYASMASVVAVSGEAKKALEEWIDGAARVHVVENGIPLTDFDASIRVKPKKLLFVGRLIPAKGVDVLIEAMGALVEQGVVTELSVLGDGPERTRLEQQARDLDLTPYVKFLGMQKDPSRWYEQRPILVQPARWEGLPLTVLEAMRSGCPIVATRVGGIPAALGPDLAQSLVLPEDVQSLVKAVSRIASDEKLADTIGRSARARFANAYTAREMAKQYAEIYSSMLR